MEKIFKSLKIGERFQITGSSLIWQKLAEEWREPFCPTNCQDEDGLGAWVGENELVQVIDNG